MNISTRILFLTASLLISSCMAARPRLSGSDPAEEKVDHFKIWKVEKITFQRPVRLKGQFDKEPWQAQVESIEYVANPVEKNDKPIRFRSRHLVAYFLRQSVEGGPRRWVEFTNQFGVARWRLTDPAFLLLPASKVFDGDPPDPPNGLDHFLCYIVRETNPVSGPIKLIDQFDRRLSGSERIQRLAPAFFCVPVEKDGGKMVNPNVHLALYDLEPRKSLVSAIAVRTRDQFGARTLKATESVMLAVPSTKTGWGPDSDGEKPN
jgi:hypothetical protein